MRVMPHTVTQPSLSGLYNTQLHNHHYLDYTTHSHTTISIRIIPNKSHNHYYQDIATHSHTVITIRIIQRTVTQLSLSQSRIYHTQLRNEQDQDNTTHRHNVISIRIIPNKSQSHHYQDISTHSHTVITIRIIQRTVTQLSLSQSRIYHTQLHN